MCASNIPVLMHIPAYPFGIKAVPSGNSTCVFNQPEAALQRGAQTPNLLPLLHPRPHLLAGFVPHVQGGLDHHFWEETSLRLNTNVGIQSQPGFALGWIRSVGCFRSDPEPHLPLCRTRALGQSGRRAAHLEWRELHIWYIQYFLKVTATFPFGRGPGARCTAQRIRIRIRSCILFEGRAKISLSAEPRLPVTSSMGAGALHRGRDLSAVIPPAAEAPAASQGTEQPAREWPPGDHRDGDPWDLSSKTLSFCEPDWAWASIREWLVPPVAKEMLATHPCPCGLGWLHAGPSTDGTLPAEGRGAGCHPHAGCHCPPPVSGTRTQKPSPFPAARDVLRTQLEQRLEHPRAARVPAGAGSMKSWAMGTSSDQPEAPRAGERVPYPPGLGAAARQGWGDAVHPCGQGEEGIKHSSLPHHAEIPQKLYLGRHRRQEITLANGG